MQITFLNILENFLNFQNFLIQIKKSENFGQSEFYFLNFFKFLLYFFHKLQ